ncbi:MAG: hypothetical protein COA42_03380 [Alteromonadaceae bacterium]|nr:MAG: hypothetical protein COA42_03380 [Alteromonadaceae bacterium]
MIRTNDEANNGHLRNNRFFKKADYWYYSTREGFNIGPFDSHSKAESGASEFIDFVMHADNDTLQTLQRYGDSAAA